MTHGLGALAGRALRANRSSQESRQCTRSARVKTSSAAVVTNDDADMALKAKPTVSRRITFNHACRMRQRGQPFHTTRILALPQVSFFMEGLLANALFALFFHDGLYTR